MVAKNAGFCFGVKKAINKAFNAVVQNNHKQIYTYGPLIHNSQVIHQLESKGILSIDDLQYGEDNIVIIRSHGVPLNIYKQAKSLNIKIIDATCPFVRKVQNIVEKYYKKKYTIVIVGNPAHPEVIGINGWCNNTAYIIENESDIDKIKGCNKICIVAQTTITLDLWNRVIDKLQHKVSVLKKFNTICIATQERQLSCAQVAKQVDAMIIIGGYHSSNTQKLLQISKQHCKNTYHIETVEELPIKYIQNLSKIGITAGASTPDWIIKEVIEKMNTIEHENNEMMNMMEEIENSFRIPRRGHTIKGKVIYITDNEIMVDIGYKSDGIVPKNEISNDPSIKPQEIIKEGDEIEVYVLKMDDGEGNILLSKKKVEAEKDWQTVLKAKEDNSTIPVKVIENVKGGVIAVYKEIKGFIPASQLSDTYVDHLEEFVGKQLDVKIIELNKQKNKIVFSRKVVMEKENEKKRQLLWESIKEGDLIDGEVKRLTNFGAFVDIGGVDGLIHISDLSWGRIKHPSEIVKPGDKIKVIILNLDKDKNRISLGLKQMTPEPWENVEEKYHVGDIIEGIIARLTNFGAFVQLEPGMDGLVHISQISHKHIAKPSEEVTIGQQVKVKILNIDKENKRISLSIKEAIENLNMDTPNPFNNDEPVTVGEIIKSKEE